MGGGIGEEKERSRRERGEKGERKGRARGEQGEREME